MRSGGYTSHCTDEIVFAPAEGAGVLRSHHARAKSLKSYLRSNADTVYATLWPMVPWEALERLRIIDGAGAAWPKAEP